MKRKYTKIYNSNDQLYLRLTHSHENVSAIYGYDSGQDAYKLMVICTPDSYWPDIIYDMHLVTTEGKFTTELVGESEIFLEKI